MSVKQYFNEIISYFHLNKINSNSKSSYNYNVITFIYYILVQVIANTYIKKKKTLNLSTVL